MLANLESSEGATGLEKISFHSNPKEGQCQECSNYSTIALISHASKVMFKIHQVRFQQHLNQEIPDVQAGYRKGRNQRSNCQHSLDHKKSKRITLKKKKNYFCFINYAKTFDFMDHNKLWKILNEIVIPDHLICFLRNLYACQEAKA